MTGFKINIAEHRRLLSWLFLACVDLGRTFDYSFPACGFFLFLFFLFEVEISSRTLIPLFMPGSVHNDSAS